MKFTKTIAGIAIAGGVAAAGFALATGVANADPGVPAVPARWGPPPPGPWHPGWDGWAPPPPAWGPPPPPPPAWGQPAGLCLFDLCLSD
jgi:hypothetical protein